MNHDYLLQFFTYDHLPPTCKRSASLSASWRSALLTRSQTTLSEQRRCANFLGQRTPPCMRSFLRWSEL